MEYKEYGSKNNDTIILLHGGGLSWWNYIDEIGLLEDEFHIVIPILDGHSNSDTNFTSIESNALEIINFIMIIIMGSKTNWRAIIRRTNIVRNTI